MKLLSLLNLINDAGKINLVNAITYLTLGNFLLINDLHSLVAFVLCIALLAIESIKAKAAVQLSDVKQYQEAVDKVSRDLRNFKLHMGFKQ